MNFKSPIYILTALLLLAGCGDKVVEVPLPVPETRSVEFLLGAEDFRSGTPADEDGAVLEAEQRIFNFAVFVFDSDGRLEGALTASPYDPAVTGSAGVDFGDALDFTDTDGRRRQLTLTLGSKTIFALVNLPRPLLEKRDGLISSGSAVLSDFTDMVLDVKGDIGLITGGGEVPAGDERGFMMMPREGPKTIYIEASQDAATISLKVARAMAKVSVGSSLRTPRNREEQPNGELTNIEYKVVNNPNEMYVLPRITGGEVITPYFYTHSEGTLDRSLYFESPGDAANGNYVTVSSKNGPTRLYCMENSNRVPSPSNATTAIIKGTYTPEVLYSADGSVYTGNFTAGMDFWRVVEHRDGEWNYTGGYYAEDPAGYLNSTQKAVRYAEGKTYYRVLLRDSGETQYPHTVRRNSYYAIDITRVNDAGSPDEDGDGEFEPPKDTEPQIRTSISLLDWTVINQNGEI